MSAAPSFSAPMMSPAPIATAAEAEKLIAHFLEVMDKLVGVLRQETDLVRGGGWRRRRRWRSRKPTSPVFISRRRCGCGQARPI